MKKSMISTIIILLIHLNGISQTTNVDAFNDFTNDVDFPAFNKEMIINIKGDSIAGYAFIANGEKLKETIIMVHGLPGYDNQSDIAQSLRRTGRNVIYFNYRGSWGSQGEFLYSNSLEDVNEVIKYLTDVENSKRLRIDINALVILGRSYGGGIALIQGSENEKVKKIIAISSMNAGSETHPIHHLNKLARWKKYLSKKVMLNVTPSIFLQDIFDNKEQYNVLTYKDLLKKKKVLLIEDTQNNQNWIKQLENVDSKMIKSDHNFISNRIELINVLIEWLNKG
ncbi:alpha/beta hydrolase [Aquimarina muelleri]|uniref:alpha/beta hydrolase n=1 Tax=Aquimarina muelleri TaxID=279356 RepID=UPI003F6836E0